ncbi:hypothetical protein EJB05_46729 [Eragrostis curvula]|uniref:DUF295 domain-containing protein n=1 Tax=Eragrostis curvula TaxID=38414 RepID=A0A5J9TNY2_9POAL|nr:hypothetical protein EJB05_46729 [Eragrostis curvula]
MARSGRGDRRRSGRPTGSVAAATERSFSSRRSSREVAAAPTTSEKICDPPVSMTTPTLVPQGWADLPEDLLQAIIVLLRSPHEAIAFSATCRSWHAAVFTSVSAFNLFTLFPPVLLQPKIPNSSLSPEFFVDLMNTESPLRCQFPWETVNKMDYIGYSHGNLIYSHKKKCHLFDAFTGTRTKSPRLVTDKGGYPIFGALTAPLASPDSSLLVQAGCFLYQWKIGSESWLKQYQIDPNTSIIQIVNFKGELFALDCYKNLFRVRLEPRFTLQSLIVLWDCDDYLMFGRWLVVCDDMLLFFGHWKQSFQAVRLDLSSIPTWVKVEKLENLAVFVSGAANSQAFACKDPERWGGRSNSVYFCSIDEPWSVVQLGDTVEPPDYTATNLFNNLPGEAVVVGGGGYERHQCQGPAASVAAPEQQRQGSAAWSARCTT